MSTGLYDIHDRAEVFHPNAIDAGLAECRAKNITHIPSAADPNRVIRVPDYIRMLKARWQRCVDTATLIDNIKAGYCSILPNDAPPSSDARH